MTTDDMVDASLAGLDQGEPITIPPMHDVRPVGTLRSGASGAV
jgi:hypothetical protein